MTQFMEYLMFFLIICLSFVGCTLGCHQVVKKQKSPPTTQVDSCKKAEKAWEVFYKRFPNPDDGAKKTQQQLNQELRSEEWIRAMEWDQACETEKANREQEDRGD